MVKKDGKKYFTLDESRVISDENIRKSAEVLIQDLRKSKQKSAINNKAYV